MPENQAMVASANASPGAPVAFTESPLAVRVRGLAVAGCCWLALGIAAWLHPNASGSGTHRDLGLPACSFLARTGWPCPSCGMTTSLSAMAHGQFRLAWRSHPFGVLLFAMLAALASAGSAQVLAARDVLARLPRPRWWVLGVFLGLPVGWATSLLIGWCDGTLPVR